MLDLVFYCVRTYVYYLHRQKQIMLGIWPGDMTVKTGCDKKFLTFRKSDNQPTNDVPSYHTNTISISGLLCPPNNSQLLPQPINVLDLSGQPQHITATALVPAAVSGVGCWSDGLPCETGMSSALDCMAGTVECSREGRAADGCHGSQCNSYSDPMTTKSSQSVVALRSPVGSIRVGVGHCEPFVQLSSSHTSLHHHQGSGTQ